MSTSVTLPALGESVTEGTVSRWLKQVGDTVEADEPLLEVSTDKVDTEIPSPTSGVLLEIRAQEDETVEVGAVLAVIGDGISVSTLSVETSSSGSSASTGSPTALSQRLTVPSVTLSPRAGRVTSVPVAAPPDDGAASPVEPPSPDGSASCT